MDEYMNQVALPASCRRVHRDGFSAGLGPGKRGGAVMMLFVLTLRSLTPAGRP
jgi:hypothetical protein